MSEINVNVTSAPITASVTGGMVSASVAAAADVSIGVSGGFGPQGASGPQGEPGPPGAQSLSALADVDVQSIADGDVLRYSAASSRWTNYAEQNLVDGGNFTWLIASGFAGPLALLLQKLC